MTGYETAPSLLNLPNNVLLLVSRVNQDDIRVTQVSGNLHATFSGVFAQDILSLFEQQDFVKSRLTLVEKQYPWLQGLVDATPLTEDGYKLLIGHGLGMLFIELTSQCNEKCIHCYADSAPERSDFLSLEEVQQVLTEARHLGQANVQFTGGDPLIHRHLVDLLAYAHDLNFASIEIYTNGLLLSQAMLDKIQPYQPKIAFSMYSHDAMTHDKITRVSGSHKRTCDAIRRAMNAGFRVRVSVIQMQENEGQENDTYAFLQHELGLSPQQIKFHLNRSIGRGSAYQPKNKVMPPMENIATKDISVKPSDSEPSEGLQQARITQPARWGKLCVSATGDVFPCIFSRNISLGNVRKSGLLHVLNDLQSRRFASASAMRWQSCQDQLSCGDCQLVTYMLGDET